MDIIDSKLMPRSVRARLLAGTALAVLSAAAMPAAAQNATWNATATVPGLIPGIFDFNADANWNTPATVPTGTAFFGFTTTPGLSFSADTTIGGWTFNAGAVNYTFIASLTLGFNGAGIVINGGSATITNNVGLSFTNNATAGSATIVNNNSLAFVNTSTAGSAIITNIAGILFNHSSTAGSATITNNFGGSGIQFLANSTAGSATITNNSGSVSFVNNSTAGSAIITNTDLITFTDASTAGSATITNSGQLFFGGNSTAGSATITNSGDLRFFNTSTAGSATITNNFGLTFFNNSTAGSATITNNGQINFANTSTAGNAAITNNVSLAFINASTAGSATIANDGFLFFLDTSTAGSATITNYNLLEFFQTSTAGSATITNNDLLQFFQTSTAGSATITTNNGGETFFVNTSSGGTARLIANGTGAVDFSGLTTGGTTAGSFEGSGNFFLGSKSITVGGNNLSTEVSGVIQDGGNAGVGGGALVKEGTGTLTLSGINTYTGATNVTGGALIVDGSIAASSGLTVDAGALVGGVGTLPSATINGTLSPGNSIGTITVNGNLAFGAGGAYVVEVSPTAADLTNVTGAASLAGTVLAIFAPGSYITRQYTILHANGGVGGAFAGLSGNIPVNFSANLSYGATDVLLNLTAALGQPQQQQQGQQQQGQLGGLSQNQRNVAGTINNFFNNGGALPPNFVSLFGLTGVNLANALTLLSGEAATGAQYGAFQLTNQFFSAMLDPLVYGGAGPFGGGPVGFGFAPGGGALRLAAEETQPPEIALAYAKILKAPPAPPAAIIVEPRWNVWAGGFGGANRTQGDPVAVGSHDVSARTGGYAAGLDYRIWPGTTVGAALAGGFTNWSLANGLGGGNSDAFQAGLYGVTRSGPAYLAGAASFARHWMATDRTALGDHLTARFDAQSFAGRLEGGWRFATFLGGVAPYAAVQAQRFHTPAYNEADATLGGFGLSYNARNASDTRSELGARFDHALPLASAALLALHARAAWAHDWVSDPTLMPVFQTLPGASFIVNGAIPVPNSALASAGGELRFLNGWLNGWALGGRFDGEFAGRAQTYAGTGTLRYVW